MCPKPWDGHGSGPFRRPLAEPWAVPRQTCGLAGGGTAPRPWRRAPLHRHPQASAETHVLAAGRPSPAETGAALSMRPHVPPPSDVTKLQREVSGAKPDVQAAGRTGACRPRPGSKAGTSCTGCLHTCQSDDKRHFSGAGRGSGRRLGSNC